ncbi:MAG: DNA-deoxyinosine glycosylase [Gammaproteobacteria bacterium]|jgi:hypoxanthine-DNA glycosylase|nr:DNA-deoxyinosine glycosylase [Gammaproteobacteria bacterium]
MDKLSQGFPPLLGAAPRILLLGSMPSLLSLRHREYYANPRNAFWPLMGELFGASPDLSYERRVRRLTDAGIAVWDVVAAGARSGSLDSAIEMSTVVVNNFARLFAEQPTLARVFFNGRKAEEIFRRRVMPELQELRPDVRYACLPSTSPALAALDFSGKLERWQVVAEAHRELV